MQRFKAVYPMNGGTVRWNAAVTCVTSMTGWQMAREHSKKRNGKNCDGPSTPFVEHWEIRNQSPQETSQESMILERKWSGKCSWAMRYTLRAVGGWSGDLLVADCEDVQESAAQEI